MQRAARITCLCLAIGLWAPVPVHAICIGDGEYHLALFDMHAREAARRQEAKAHARGQTLMPAHPPQQTPITKWPDFAVPQPTEIAHATPGAARPN